MKTEKKYRNLLVTGGCGFIGSNFINYALNQQSYFFNRIVNLDKLTYAGDIRNTEKFNSNELYRFVQGDICDKNKVNEILREYNIDSVMHFAAESHVDNSILGPYEFIKTNILGTYNLLDCSHNFQQTAKINDFIFVHVSTDEVYGSLNFNDPSFTETNQYQPNSPYSASKASSDHLARAWYETYDFNTIITNCSNNYGPYQNKEKLIPKIINNALNHAEIPIYGDGKNIRDWLYVEDHCKALLKIMFHGDPGNTYNIGGINEIENITLVTKICELLDKKIPINSDHHSSYKDLIRFVKDRPGHDLRYSIDTTKIFKSLGWKPEETFDTGIEKTIEWYLERIGIEK